MRVARRIEIDLCRQPAGLRDDLDLIILAKAEHPEILGVKIGWRTARTIVAGAASGNEAVHR